MINYKLIAQSINYYENLNYQRIEAPWLVTAGILNITKPIDASQYRVKKDTEQNEKCFVASGEQSFLYLINKGHLPNYGKFQTITPCLRNDDFDIFHRKYFIKNELIIYSTDYKAKSILDMESLLNKMINDVIEFFNLYVPIEKLKVIKTVENMFDIMYNDIEIGSYGIRECSFCTWIYGTGIAEPRFSIAAKEYI